MTPDFWAAVCTSVATFCSANRPVREHLLVTHRSSPPETFAVRPISSVFLRVCVCLLACGLLFQHSNFRIVLYLRARATTLFLHIKNGKQHPITCIACSTGRVCPCYCFCCFCRGLSLFLSLSLSLSLSFFLSFFLSLCLCVFCLCVVACMMLDVACRL